MIVKEITDTEHRAHLDSLPKDGISRFTLLDGTIKGAVISGTRLVSQAAENHHLGVLESLALGQALLSCALLSTSIKDEGRISIRMDCSGPLKGYSVETNEQAMVRGYLFSEGIRLDKELKSFDLQPFIGSGTLSVMRTHPDHEPYSGHIELVHGRIAEDITEYFLRSEQTHTALAVSIRFDTRGKIAGAGGIFLQAMPGAKDLDLEDAQDRIREADSLGNWLSEGRDSRAYMDSWFGAFEVQDMGWSPASFYCPCSRERFRSFLVALGTEEINKILDTGPLPLVLLCHNCGSSYAFEKDELLSLIH